VELVEDLSAVEPEHIDTPEPAPVAIRLVDVSGYLDLAEARQARDELHQHKITSELVIRTSPETPADGDVVEEYWLRADAGQIRQIRGMVEGLAPAPDDTVSTEFKCSNCTRPVREEESFCANCGKRFSK
jgi:hypothetical protein